MPLRILVTGFEPFQNQPFNPSGLAALAANGRAVHTTINGSLRSGTIQGRVLHVLWGGGPNELLQHISSVHPHIVISTGMASTTFRVEQRADDQQLPIADNQQNLPPTVRATPTRFRATRLPIARIEQAIRTAGGPVSPSNSAGGFLCDQVFLTLMDLFYTRGAALGLLRAGFIHTPSNDHVAAPGFASPGPTAIAQSIVNTAILGAVTATVADLTDAEYQRTQP
ncbi:MAG: hypothetical protein IPK82_02665 [Polyangiaceae bacterium]|nr:hypothetical protein [Polyangiaceae bacterium]